MQRKEKIIKNFMLLNPHALTMPHGFSYTKTCATAGVHATTVLAKQRKFVSY